MVRVQDLGREYILVQDTQDRIETMTSIGYINQGGSIADYGCLFVKQQEGEIISVYGCESFTPWLRQRVDKLL